MADRATFKQLPEGMPRASIVHASPGCPLICPLANECHGSCLVAVDWVPSPAGYHQVQVTATAPPRELLLLGRDARSEASVKFHQVAPLVSGCWEINSQVPS